MGMEGPQMPGQSGGDKISRGDFLKKLGVFAAVAATTPATELFSQSNQQEKIPKTYLHETTEKFANGKSVYELQNELQQRLGEFWPISTIKLVTKQINPELFTQDLKDMHKTFVAMGTAPDGMTTGPMGARIMQGKSLSEGRPCGDGKVYNYGIVIAGKDGITFTHANEHSNDFDLIYQDAINKKESLFFLPSVFRNGAFIASQKTLDKVLIRRDTPKGAQIGVVLFDSLLTYDDARKEILGLDRAGKSSTTHIYMLDGGGTWGQSSKEVNGQVKKMGTRDLDEVTNYLIFD